MTFQHDAEGVPPEGTQSEHGDENTSADERDGVNGDADGDSGAQDAASQDSVTEGTATQDSDIEPGETRHSAPAAAESPQHSRALLALVAAGTVAVAPIADTVLGPAGGGDGAHSSPVFLLAEVSHDIGHNDWAFQGGLDDRFIWVATYVAIALAWLGITLWLRTRDRRAARAAASAEAVTPANEPEPTSAPKAAKLWLKTLTAALATQLAAGALTIGAGLYAQWTATDLGPVVLRLADLCSPWWSCVAALIVVARAERNTVALRAAIVYGAVLALMLLVPLPGPGSVKALILAATAAIPALLVPRPRPRSNHARATGQLGTDPPASGRRRSRLKRFAVACWILAST